MKSLNPTLSILYICTLCLFSSLSSANAINVDKDGIAIHGYDPISYTQGQPSIGKRALTYEYQGAKYQFSSKENLEQFKLSPSEYTPVFGGFCAYGIRMGKKLDINPLAYKYTEKQLYFLLDRSTQQLWDQDIERNIAIAERLWPSLKDVSVKNSSH